MIAMAPPLARTPLYHWQAAHGARFIDRDGWQVAASYAGSEKEVAAAQAGLGLADISACAKLSFRGTGVATVLSKLLPNAPAPKPLTVAVLPSEPTLACRLSEDHLLLLCSTPQAPLLRQRLADPAVLLTDVTCTYAGLELIGPRLEEVLRRLADVDLRPSAFPVNSCAETALAGVEALLVRPSERSVRIYVGWDLGEYVWERVMEAGRQVPITPVGLEALQSL